MIAAPRSVSPLTASFIGPLPPGIHRAPFVASHFKHTLTLNSLPKVENTHSLVFSYKHVNSYEDAAQSTCTARICTDPHQERKGARTEQVFMLLYSHNTAYTIVKVQNVRKSQGYVHGYSPLAKSSPKGKEVHNRLQTTHEKMESEEAEHRLQTQRESTRMQNPSTRQQTRATVEDSGIEPLTYGMQIRRSPS